jgi:uncharacterized protein YuzE
MEKSRFSYDDYSDSIIISNKQDNEVVRNNFEVGDMIFSLTGKGKIVSIEIKEFSSFLESCGFNPSLVKDIDGIELKVIVKKETIFLLLKINFTKNECTFTENIPLILPLVSQ